MSDDNEILSALTVPLGSRPTQITIETRTTTVIRTTGGELQTAFCDVCQAVVAELSSADALAVLGIGQSELELFQKGGGLHSTRTGALCGRALVDHSRREVAIDSEGENTPASRPE